MTEALEIFLAGLTGLCFGSFVTLASWRLPREEKIAVAFSRCTTCSHRLHARDLVPLLSWCANGRACRFCGAVVHWRYPLTELITAALFLLIYARWGLTAEGVILALMSVALMVMVVVDLEHYIIPDEVHLVLLPLAFCWHWLQGSDWWNVAQAVLIALVLSLMLRMGYQWLRKKEGLGMGDVKFFAVTGLWLGAKALVPFLFLSGVLGVAMALLWRGLGHGRLFPFGPALAAALFLCAAFPEVSAFFWRTQEWMYR